MLVILSRGWNESKFSFHDSREWDGGGEGTAGADRKKKTLFRGWVINIQSTLVISTSVISNKRLSRRENLFNV